MYIQKFLKGLLLVSLSRYLPDALYAHKAMLIRPNQHPRTKTLTISPRSPIRASLLVVELHIVRRKQSLPSLILTQPPILVGEFLSPQLASSPSS